MNEEEILSELLAVIPSDAEHARLGQQRVVGGTRNAGLFDNQVGLELVDAVVVGQDRRRDVGGVRSVGDDGVTRLLDGRVGAEAPALAIRRFSVDVDTLKVLFEKCYKFFSTLCWILKPLSFCGCFLRGKMFEEPSKIKNILWKNHYSKTSLQICNFK